MLPDDCFQCLSCHAWDLSPAPSSSARRDTPPRSDFPRIQNFPLCGDGGERVYFLLTVRNFVRASGKTVEYNCVNNRALLKDLSKNVEIKKKNFLDLSL